MDDSQHVMFVTEAHPPLAAALARVAGDTELGRRAAEEALVTALTRWKQVARIPAPIGWCYLRGLEELRAASVDLDAEDQRIAAAGDVATAARRVHELRSATDPPITVDAGALVQRARRRRSLQTLVGMVIALGGVVGLALLLAWLQSPAV